MTAELLTKEDVMKVLQVSRGTIDNMRAKGELPYVRVGAGVRFRQEDVGAYISSRLVSGKAH